MLTAEQEKAAKEAEAAAAKTGAKEGDALTPEQLKAAQDKAEEFRKEKEDLEEELDSKKEELEKLQKKIKADDASAAEKKRAELLKAGITDDEILVAQVEALIAKGDTDWRAIDKLVEKRARKIAKEEIASVLSARDMEIEFDRRDELIEDRLKEWNKDKPKDEKLSAEKLKEMVGAHANPALDGRPLRQFKDAWAKFVESDQFRRDKAAFEEEKRKNGQYRDQGTGADKGGEKTTPKSWRDAKTPAEKDAQLASL